MRKYLFLSTGLLFFTVSAYAQFPLESIPADSSIFVGWATQATVERGYRNIAEPDSGLVDAGMPELATGPADGQVVSLGDSGRATLQFDFPVEDGPGPDFAVFENGFASGGAFFLELAFVEVSSDGQNFVRFPATSLTDTGSQVAPFGLLEPELLNNLAGKYVVFEGAPFDLAELAGAPGLDVSAVTHLRVVDVVGSIDSAFATYDAEGRAINDPWPTPFASGGFDLDAVGVIHENRMTTSTEIAAPDTWQVYPNPIRNGEAIEIKGVRLDGWQLFDAAGRLVLEGKGWRGRSSFSLAAPRSGIYFFRGFRGDQFFVRRLVVE